MSSFNVQTFSNRATAAPAGAGQIGLEIDAQSIHGHFRSAVKPLLGTGTSNGNWTPTSLGPVLDVTTFKNDDGTYVGSGASNDASGIQAAIDSIPHGSGALEATDALGRAIFFPAGTYNITETINVPGTIAIVGDAINSTRIAATLPTGTNSAFTLVSDLDPPAAFGVHFRNLAIYTDQGFGITAIGGAINSTFEHLLFSTGNYGIYFSGGDGNGCQGCTFKDLQFAGIGGGVLAIDGNDNTLEDVDVEGGVRNDFAAPSGTFKPLIDVRGFKNTLRNFIVEPADLPSAVTPYYFGPSFVAEGSNWTGHLIIENCWLEMSPDDLLNNRAWVFDTVHGVHWVHGHLINSDSQVYVVASDDVFITQADLTGEGDNKVSNCFTFGDATSKVHIGKLVCAFDPGDLESTQIQVDTFRRTRDPKYQSKMLHAPRTRNILPNGDFERGLLGWSIPNDGGATGWDVSVVDDPDGMGKALKVHLPNGSGTSGVGFYVASPLIVLPTNRANSPGFFGVNIKADPAVFQAVALGLPPSYSFDSSADFPGLIVGKSTSINTGDAMDIRIVTLPGQGGDLYLRMAHCVLGNVYNYEPIAQESQCWVGTGNVIVQGSAAPNSGSWKQGDLVYNTAPVASSGTNINYVGWVCVTGNTNGGSWKPFGAVSS